MSDGCTFFHKKHVLEAKVTGSNLPLIRCLRCRRQWDHYGYERIPSLFKSWKAWEASASTLSQSPEYGLSKYITLHADELNPVLVEYVIKSLNIQDKATIVALREMGKEKRFNIANQLFK